MTDSISVLLADDHQLVSQLLSDLISLEVDMRVVAIVANAQDALTECLRLHPDVALIDIDMPGTNSFDSARDIATRCTNTRIVFLSAYVQDRYIQRALEVGASGYVAKLEPPVAVLTAIRAAASGDTYFSPQVRERIVEEAGAPRLPHGSHSRLSLLTPRELGILGYVAQGMSKKEIAGLLHISANTVDNHINNLMSKLDIHNRVSLTRFAIREGLVDP